MEVAALLEEEAADAGGNGWLQVDMTGGRGPDVAPSTAGSTAPLCLLESTAADRHLAQL